MAEKTNYWTQVISAMNSRIRFGGISSDKLCTESIKIEAKDGRQRVVMEEDGPRTGWTSIYTPGKLHIHAQMDDVDKKDTYGVFLLAENGDIVVSAPKGRIKFEAENIEFVAKSEDGKKGNIAFNCANDFDVVSCRDFKVQNARGNFLVNALNMVGLKGFQVIHTITQNWVEFTSHTRAVEKKKLTDL